MFKVQYLQRLVFDIRISTCFLMFVVMHFGGGTMECQNSKMTQFWEVQKYWCHWLFHCDSIAQSQWIPVQVWVASNCSCEQWTIAVNNHTCSYSTKVCLHINGLRRSVIIEQRSIKYLFNAWLAKLSKLSKSTPTT